MKYSVKQKIQSVQDYVTGTEGLKLVAKRHCVDVSALRWWIAMYREHGTAGLEVNTRKQRFDANFKLSILRHVKRDGLSFRRAAVINKIGRFDIIGTWQRQYDAGGFAALSLHGNSRREKLPMPPKSKKNQLDRSARTREELLEENAFLRMENVYLKKARRLSSGATAIGTKEKALVVDELR